VRQQPRLVAPSHRLSNDSLAAREDLADAAREDEALEK
jgi:hypothetical protein